MKNKTFGLIIAGGIIGAFIVVAIALLFTSQNKAINLEEQIYESTSAINVQEKRRIDLLLNLVDTVQAYDDHEKETLVLLTEARTQASNGSVEEAQLAINAVAEAYPELKSIDNYKNLMTEMAVTENLIAEFRGNYNAQVRAYNKFTRKFPTRYLLNISGYEKIESKYLEYDAPEDAPTNLFDSGK